MSPKIKKGTYSWVPCYESRTKTSDPFHGDSSKIGLVSPVVAFATENWPDHVRDELARTAEPSRWVAIEEVPGSLGDGSYLFNTEEME
ncbi:hypothetical protein KKC60_03085 [Patescibacteria group bacterium]|nr:hypothetical protein [Patescibacteria group bacterium]